MLSCPAHPSGIPKVHSEDVRNKHKIFKLKSDPDTDMKASIDFNMNVVEVVIGENSSPDCKS